MSCLLFCVFIASFCFGTLYQYGFCELAQRQAVLLRKDKSPIRAIERDYGDLLYSRVVKLEEIPKDIYLDENKHIHVIVQTYVLAPYATGIIDVDLDKE